MIINEFNKLSLIREHNKRCDRKTIACKFLSHNMSIYIVANGDLSKNITRKWIFLVANATVLVAVWSPGLTSTLLGKAICKESQKTLILTSSVGEAGSRMIHTNIDAFRQIGAFPSKRN